MKGHKALHLFYGVNSDTKIRVSTQDENFDNYKAREYKVTLRNIKRIQNLVNRGSCIVSHIYDEYGSSTFVYNR